MRGWCLGSKVWGEAGEEKKVCLLFLSPGCGSIKSIWGANSCQSLNPISLRGQPEVDKNSSGIEVGSTGGQKGHNNGLEGGGEAATPPATPPEHTHTHTQPSNLANVLTLPRVSLALALCHYSPRKVPPSLRLSSLELCLALYLT